ncbi:MAG: hypothetical protein E6H40_04010 [Betaproteobacteria bacterium]|nr:MAG: hypothetical protein E6H40_04010 [Betaproteobacteria bacterium]
MRAVLLMGALAGMALVSAAHAQIAFRNSTFASIPGGGIPALRAAAAGGAPMTIVGESRMPASDDSITKAASAAIVPPAGMQNKDVILLFVSAMVPSSTLIQNTVSGGQTWWSIPGGQIGSNPTARVFKTIFNGSWSGTPNIPAFSWGATAVTYQMWMIVLRGADTIGVGTQPVNDYSCCGGSTNYLSGTFSAALPSPYDVAISGFTTTTDNAMVFAHWYSADDNTWSLQTPGWSQPGGQPPWRTMAVAGGAGADTSMSIAYLTQATAGPVAAVTNRQATLGPKAGAYRLFAMRPGGIRKPPGTVAGDVMIASLAFANNASPSITITPPAGWNLVKRIDQASAPLYSLAIYWRAADASDASVSSYVFDLSNPSPNAWVGGIQSFSGVDTTNPIDVQNGQVTASALTHATPSGLATTGPNRLLVTTHMVSNGTVTGWTAPAGMTETLDFRSGINLTGAVATSTVLQATQGTIPTKTASIAGATAYTGAAHILALRPAASGGSNTLTIAKPAGVQQNDVMIASIAVGPYDVTITPPAGWALVRRTNQASGTSNSLAVYSKLAGAPASDLGPYGWTFSASHTGAAGGIQAFSGADPLIAIAEENGQNDTASVTAHATPSVNTTYSNTMIITSYGVGATSTWSPPPGMNETANLQGGSQAFEMSWVLQAAPASNISKTATSSSTGYGNAHILALRRVLGSFNGVETGTSATTGVIKTKIAGTSVNLDIAALNAAKDLIAPAFVGTVGVEVVDASDILGGTLVGENCRSTWTLIQTLSDLTFAAGDSGRKNISFTVPNSYRNLRLRMTSPTGAPAITACSSDAFAIRPNTLASFAVTDTDWQTTGTPGARVFNLLTFAATTPIHKAGRPFSVRATAVNAAGTPATTTNYTGAPTATLTACVGAACTATFGTLTLGATFVAGQLTSDVASYDNVGSFTLQLVDSDFASVDAADTTGDCTASGRYVCSATLDVGRFVPDHFAVALNTPSFGTACAAGGFTYLGQPLNYTTAPVITVTAQGLANNTTTLYAGAWSRITNSTLMPATQLSRYSRFDALGGGNTPALDPTGLPATTADPVIGTFTAGVGALTFGSGTGLRFARATPVAPFNADIALALNVIDADSVAYAGNPAAFGTATAGNGIAFGSGRQMRFGRLALRNANGSQLVPLPVQVEAQYAVTAGAGIVFITNKDDSCTSLANNNVQMSSFTANLAACQTAVSGGGALSSGRIRLLLPPPGNANNGSVLLTANLGTSSSGTTCTSVGGGTVSAAGASRTYLQGNWAGSATYADNPSARATFGTFKGSEEVIFIRENF